MPGEFAAAPTGEDYVDLELFSGETLKMPASVRPSVDNDEVRYVTVDLPASVEGLIDITGIQLVAQGETLQPAAGELKYDMSF